MAHGGFRARGFRDRFFSWLADIPRRHADRIIVLGECMRDRLLRAHNLDPDKLTIAHNWAPDDFPDPTRDFAATGPLSVVYSGNFGLAHDVETLSSAMLQLAGSEIGFVFAGGGSRHAWLQDFCARNHLAAASFPPYCERHALPARLAASQIGLVTQKTECLGSAVPSKTYAIMSVGRPILFVGPKQSTPALIVARHHCGWQIDCGDVAGLVALLRHLDENRNLIHTAGARAREAFLAHYQQSIGVATVAAACLGDQAALSRVGPTGVAISHAAGG